MFKWNDKCEEAFYVIKTTISSAPILEKPKIGRRLLLYLFVSEDVISSTLVQKEEYKPVYFTSQTLQDAKTKYQVIEKATLALVYIARRLMPYFWGHPITVKTDYPVGKVFLRPHLAGNIVSWSIQLSEFELSFEPREPIKAQCRLCIRIARIDRTTTRAAERIVDTLCERSFKR